MTTAVQATVRQATVRQPLAPLWWLLFCNFLCFTGNRHRWQIQV